MKPKDVSTCGGTERRWAIPRLGLEPTLSGAESSSNWGLYMPGMGMRE